ncbi:MAG: hypothetical protein ACOZBH_01210 [Patescibacteria group bacterium]
MRQRIYRKKQSPANRDEWLSKTLRIPHMLVLSKNFELFRQLQNIFCPINEQIFIVNTEDVIYVRDLTFRYQIRLIFIDEQFHFNLDPLLDIGKYGRHFIIVGVKSDSEFWKNDIVGWGADYRIPNPIRRSHVFEVFGRAFEEKA